MYLMLSHTKDAPILVSDMESGHEISRVSLPSGHVPVPYFSLSGDGRILATLSDPPTILTWQLPEGVLLSSTTLPQFCTSIRLNGDGVWAVVCLYRGPTLLLNTHTNSMQELYTDPPTLSGIPVPIACITWDGSKVVVTFGTSLLLWDRFTQHTIRPSVHHRESISALALNTKEDMVASACRYDIRTWDASTGQLLHTLSIDRRTSLLAFNPLPDPSSSSWQLASLQYSMKAKAEILDVYDVTADGQLSAVFVNGEIRRQAFMTIPSSLCFTSDARVFISTRDYNQGNIYVCDLHALKIRRSGARRHAIRAECSLLYPALKTIHIQIFPSFLPSP